MNFSRLKDVLSYCSDNRPIIEYIGCLGIDNLGDEALFHATKKIFSPTVVRPAFSPLNRLRLVGKRINKPSQHMVILGGGTLIANRYYIRQFEDHTTRLGAGSVFGTGVEDPRLIQGDDLALYINDIKRTLPLARYVGVRGPLSKGILEEFGVRAEIEVIGDLACYFTKPAAFWSPKKGSIGINIGHSNGNFFGSEENFLKVMRDFVVSLDRQGFDITFFVVWPEDFDVTSRVVTAAGLKSAKIVSEFHDPGAYMDQVSKMEVFLGVKLHAVVLAMCAGVPSIAMEYRPKCRDFMASVGAEKFVIRTDQLTPETLIEATSTLMCSNDRNARLFLDKMLRYKDMQFTKAAELTQSLLKNKN